MEIRVLKYFLVVAREENITKAAKILHITQPTLSRQLMQLEEELGVSLYVRGRANIRLTNAGLMLKRRAEELVELSRITKEEIAREENEEICGSIAIGAVELNSTVELAQLITRFRSLYPMVSFKMFSGGTDTVRERVDNGLLDFGLIMEPITLKKYEFMRMKTSERWSVLVRHDSPLAKKEAVTRHDLIDLPLIGTGRESVRTEFSNWFGVPYDELNVVATHDLLNTAALLVEAGLGVALHIEGPSLFYDKNRFACIPLYPEKHATTAIIWKKNVNTSVAVNKFAEFLKQY